MDAWRAFDAVEAKDWPAWARPMATAVGPGMEPLLRMWFALVPLLTVFYLCIPTGPMIKGETRAFILFDIVSTAASSLTAVLSLSGIVSNEYATAITCAFFTVDLLVMADQDARKKGGLVKNVMKQSRLQMYLHHVVVMFVGVVIGGRAQANGGELDYQARCGGYNPWVAFQTNEVSSIFYNSYRLTGFENPFIGAAFVISFVLSRMVYNNFYVIPAIFSECRHPWALLPWWLPYQLLNFVWLKQILDKARETLFADKSKAPKAKTR